MCMMMAATCSVCLAGLFDILISPSFLHGREAHG